MDTTAIDGLRSRIRGTILTVGDSGYDDARGVFNTRIDQRPWLVALPENADDVREIVAFAVRHDMRIAAQRTGHNAEPLPSLERTLLLRTDRMREVQIDPERLTARVGAGAKWEDVVPQASEVGLAALHGSTPDVSIAGYAMGGGVGWYGRKLGLAANSVTAFELVTADGRLRRVDADHDPELFWALRGGGGNFGIVTSLEIRLFDMPKLYAGVLFFRWDRSAEVLHAWHEWTKTAPDETTSVGRIIQFPADPEIPEWLRGGSFAVVEAFHMGDEAEGLELMRPLRELGPLIDTFEMIAPVGLSEVHMDPTAPLPYIVDHLVLGDLTNDAIDRLVAAVGPGSGSDLISVEIRHLGGAMSRAPENHGALAAMPGEYMVFGVGVTPDEAAEREVRASLDAMVDAVSSHGSGMYFNFTEHRVDPADIYEPETYRRLQAVKRAIDPDNRFLANHSIPPEAEVISLDDHRPTPHVIANTSTTRVDADEATTRNALERVDLAGPGLRALQELGLGDRVIARRSGISWQIPGTSGTVDVAVEIDVTAASDDGSWLTIATRFSASDEDARIRLLDAWALVGPIASSLAERAARSIKGYAERDDFETEVDAPAARAA